MTGSTTPSKASPIESRATSSGKSSSDSDDNSDRSEFRLIKRILFWRHWRRNLRHVALEIRCQFECTDKADDNDSAVANEGSLTISSVIVMVSARVLFRSCNAITALLVNNQSTRPEKRQDP